MNSTFHELQEKTIQASQSFPNKWDAKSYYIDLAEEVGELGEDLLVLERDKILKDQNNVNLEKDMGDAFLKLIMFANACHIDLEANLLKTISEIHNHQ